MNRKDRCGGVATLRSKVLTILRLAGYGTESHVFKKYTFMKSCRVLGMIFLLDIHRISRYIIHR